MVYCCLNGAKTSNAIRAVVQNASLSELRGLVGVRAEHLSRPAKPSSSALLCEAEPHPPPQFIRKSTKLQDIGVSICVLAERSTGVTAVYT